MDPDPSSFIALLLPALWVGGATLGATLMLLLLILCSALISGSEVAFFGLGPKDVHYLQDEKDRSSNLILSLIAKPRTLLATILICNNFINIAIVVVSNYLVGMWLGPDRLASIGQNLYQILPIASSSQLASAFNFLITVIGVTSILVLFGEVAPKVYANVNNLRFARLMAIPLAILDKLCSPFSSILVGWSNKLEHRLQATSSSNTSREDIDKAIELTVSDSATAEDEVDMLKGIVKFGDVTAKQIMKSRVDIVALDRNSGFDEVLRVVKDTGYSRIPVYDEDLDSLHGILYAKDLLGFTSEKKDFVWQELIREGVLYVPESKKIDDLLREFQLKRTHIGIVVDEYGGSAGLITLEDVMEEVVGEIKDEFDDEDGIEYVQLGDKDFVFEGKSLINDVCRVINKDTSYFDEIRGDADSLAGLILETTGTLPKREQKVTFKDIDFRIVAVTKRRIERINVKIR